MPSTLQPDTFIDGYRLIDGTELNDKFGNPQWSLQGSVAATPGGTVANSIKVVATITNVTSAAFGAGITLPQALPGRLLMVLNQAANPITVYAEGGSTIDAVPGNIGITLQPDEAIYFVAVQTNQWIHLSFLPIGFPLQFMQILQNINALRLWSSLPGASPKIIALVDNVVPNDGGGLFWLDASDNTTPDNGTTVIVDAVGNRWKRELVQAGYIANVPYRYVVSTNVQGALNELENDKLLRTDSIASLRSITPLIGETVYLAGYYAAGDGGSGNFYAEVGAAPGTYVDNGGTIIVPTGGDGSTAWLREIISPVSVKCFGAKGDGVTDDAPAILACLTAVDVIYMPSGIYGVMATAYNYYGNYPALVIPANKTVITDGYSTVIQQIINPSYLPDPQPIVVIGGPNVTFAQQGIKIIGNIATRAPIEFEHAVSIITNSAPVGTVAIYNVVLGDLWAENISGDAVLVSVRLDYGPDLVDGVTLGNIYADNVLRNGLAIVGGKNVYCSSVYGPAIGFLTVDVEPESVQSGPVDNVHIGRIVGTYFSVAPNSPGLGVYSRSITVDQLDLDDSFTTDSTPGYAPRAGLATQPRIRIRDCYDLYIGIANINNVSNAALGQIAGGFYGVFNIVIGQLYATNVASAYTAYIVCPNVAIGYLYADVLAGKSFFASSNNLSIENGYVTLNAGCKLFSDATNCNLANAVVSGVGILAQNSTDITFSNVMFDGVNVAGFGCGKLSIDTMTATTSGAVFVSSSAPSSVINSTINSNYYPNAIVQNDVIAANYGVVLYASLPPAATATQGAKAFLIDGNLAYTAANLGAIVAGGGANRVPVYSNGVDWLVG